jgi:hypothetical protein
MPDTQPPSAVSATVSDRRSSPRLKGRPVSVLVASTVVAPDPFPGWVLDRSSGGFCLQVDEPVPVHTIVSIRRTDAQPIARWVRLEVRNSRPVRSSWHIGCQFVQKLLWQQIREFA